MKDKLEFINEMLSVNSRYILYYYESVLRSKHIELESKSTSAEHIFNDIIFCYNLRKLILSLINTHAKDRINELSVLSVKDYNYAIKESVKVLIYLKEDLSSNDCLDDMVFKRWFIDKIDSHLAHFHNSFKRIFTNSYDIVSNN